MRQGCPVASAIAAGPEVQVASHNDRPFEGRRRLVRQQLGAGATSLATSEPAGLSGESCCLGSACRVAGAAPGIVERLAGFGDEFPVVAIRTQSELKDAKGPIILHFAVGDGRAERGVVLAARP